jgi:hypothetical protein
MCPFVAAKRNRFWNCDGSSAGKASAEEGPGRWGWCVPLVAAYSGGGGEEGGDVRSMAICGTMVLRRIEEGRSSGEQLRARTFLGSK